VLEQEGLGPEALASVYFGTELHKSGHCVVEESLVGFAEVTLAVPVAGVTCGGAVFHTAAPADGEAATDEALITELLLGTGELALLSGGGELL